MVTGLGLAVTAVDSVNATVTAAQKVGAIINSTQSNTDNTGASEKEARDGPTYDSGEELGIPAEQEQALRSLLENVMHLDMVRHIGLTPSMLPIQAFRLLYLHPPHHPQDGWSGGGVAKTRVRGRGGCSSAAELADVKYGVMLASTRFSLRLLLK